jgi:hypothetical protein
MNTTKTLTLAAVTALSLCFGAAMAQEQGGPSFAPTTWSIPALPSATIAPQASQNGSQALQFGSSDAIRNEDLGMKAYDAYNPYTGGN